MDQEVVVKRQDFSRVNLLKELRFHPKDWHNFLRMNESLDAPGNRSGTPGKF